MFSKRILASVLSVGEVKMKSEAVRIINEESVKVFSEDFNYEDIINIEKDSEGNITMVRADTVKQNYLASQVVLNCDEKLSELGDLGVKIPLGYLTNNIMFYNDDLEKFDKVCKICLIDEIVEKRKFRYDFGVCNDSSNISGGEKQRIILARGLMNNFEVLILDEALSETDYEMEAKIIKNILKSYPDKTILYISHKKQDNLFERVIEIGGKNELL